jgi:predicted P-loop ATPase
MGELAAIRKQDDEHVKTFVVRQFDKYRPPYGENEVDEPRQCVFMGTTNKVEFLHDETGARRYWPIKVEKINLEWLRDNRDQLFAEAKYCFDKGEKWWPLDGWEERHAKPEQAKYQETDSAWSDAIAPWLENKDRVRTSEIFEHPIYFESVKDIRLSDYGRLDRVMVGLGWKKHRDRHGTIWVKGVG